MRTSAIAIGLIALAGCDVVFGLDDPAIPHVTFVQASCVLGNFSTTRPLAVALSTPSHRGDFLVGGLNFIVSNFTIPTAVIASPQAMFVPLVKTVWSRGQENLYVSVLSDAPEGITTVGATPISGDESGLFCVSEYAGARDVLPTITGTGSASAASIGVEPVSGVALPTSPNDLTYLVVVEALQLPLTLTLVGVTQRDSIAPPPPLPPTPPTLEMFVLDSADSIATTDTIATFDSTGGNYDNWGVAGIVIPAQPPD